MDKIISQLNGKNVLVTGATGLLGANIAYTIAANCDAKLYLMCRNKSKAKELFNGINCELIFQDVREKLNAQHIDYIIHTAAPVGPTVFAENPLDVISVNVASTLSLVQYAVEHKCLGMVFASTHEVYEVADPLKPRSCYVLAKQTAENIIACAAQQHGVRAMSARLSRLYGPLMNLDSGLFICDFIKDILNKRPIHVKGELNLIRPLCHVTDAVSAMLQILLKGSAGEAYDIQGYELPTIGDIADICAKLGKQTVLANKPETKELPPSGRFLNCDKLKSLGWQPLTPLETGLERTIRHFAEAVK